MSNAIKRMIKKHSEPYEIQRFNRDEGEYDDDDGIWVDSKKTKEIVKIHIQPVNDQLNDGVAAQRSLNVEHGWSTDEINNKDIVTNEGELFTISNTKKWFKIYREFDMTRSGEAENLDDT